MTGCGGGGSSDSSSPTTSNEQAGSLSLSVVNTLEPGGSTTANVTVNSAITAIGVTDSAVDVTLADTSICSPKLTIVPATQSVAIGSTASFEVTAPNAVCTHQLQASTSSLSTESPTTVTVVPSAASITVGLFDSVGINSVTAVTQGSSIKLKFTGNNLSNVSTTQSYQTQTTASGVTLSNSGQCSLSASQTSCELTVIAAGNAPLASAATITLSPVGTTTVVPLSASTLTYDVVAPQGALSALNLNNQALNLLLLYYATASLFSTQTVIVKNTGVGDLSNINPSGTDLSINNNICTSTLSANATCQFDVALSGLQTFGQTKSLTITADNAPANVTIPVLVGVGLAQTGQTSTLPIDPAPTGSDGDLQKGVAWPDPRFVAGMQSDGTTSCPINQEVIVDNLTGLMWPKNGIIGFESTDGGGPIAQPDYANTTANLNTMLWSDALTAVSNMNTATTKLCGYSDWRLPNRKELYSLINFGQPDPAVWLNDAGQGFSNIQSTYYWSSSTYAANTTLAAVVNFTDGNANAFNDLTSNYVLPVRGPN